MGRRILTATVALPVLFFVVWQGDLWFAALVGLAAALGAWELSRMAGAWGQRPFMPIAVALATLLAVTYYVIPGPKYPENMEGIAIFPALLALSAAVAILLIHRLRGPFSRVLITACVIAVIGGALFHAPLLREFDSLSPNAGLLWVIFLLGVTMATDTAAYLVGKAIGSHKLAPNVSPNKTWEGAVGGFLGAVAVGVCLNGVLELGAHISVAAAGSAVMGITGQFGDLFESKLKRMAGIKDSGRIFPGHGGILDRMDSLMWNLVVLYHMVALSSGSMA